MIADSLQACCDNANLSAGLVHTALKRRHLEIQKGKPQSLPLQPDIIPQGIFRRGDRTLIKPTKKRLRELRTREVCHGDVIRAAILDFDPMEDLPISPPEGTTRHPFPFLLADEVRILGVLFDRHLTMDGQYASILAKARLRQAILSRVSHTTWGLETLVLKVTYDAIMSSLLRYGLTVLGSCWPEDLANAMDVNIANTFSRKITGLPRTVRIESLHFLADANSYRNPFIRHCAQFVHSALVSHGSLSRERIRKEINAILKLPDRNIITGDLDFDRMETFQQGNGGEPAEIIDAITWQASNYTQQPALKNVIDINSTYYVHAQEFRRITSLRKNLSFNFAGVLSWLDVGLAAVCRAGWRPECSQSEMINLGRALPPPTKKAQYYVSERSTEQRKAQQLSERTDKREIVQVVAGVIKVDDISASIACLMLDNNVQICHGYVHGKRIPGGGAIFLHEVALLDALRVLRNRMTGHPTQPLVDEVIILAGDGDLRNTVKRWFEKGECMLRSAAAADIVERIQTKNIWCAQRTLLYFFCFPDSFQETPAPNLSTQLFMSIAEHFRTAAATRYMGNWKEKLPCLPCTTGEIKDILLTQFSQDEQTVLTKLAELGSQSAQIITKLQLTREIIKEAPRELRDERRAQNNLLQVLSAARYKMLSLEGLQDTVCPLQACNSQDTFKHMLLCYDLSDPVQVGAASVTFLTKMARKTQILDPKAPRPFVAPPPEQ